MLQHKSEGHVTADVGITGTVLSSSCEKLNFCRLFFLLKPLLKKAL
jgi:hypothetical protein